MCSSRIRCDLVRGAEAPSAKCLPATGTTPDATRLEQAALDSTRGIRLRRTADSACPANARQPCTKLVLTTTTPFFDFPVQVRNTVRGVGSAVHADLALAAWTTCSTEVLAAEVRRAFGAERTRDRAVLPAEAVVAPVAIALTVRGAGCADGARCRRVGILRAAKLHDVGHQRRGAARTATTSGVDHRGVASRVRKRATVVATGETKSGERDAEQAHTRWVAPAQSSREF